MTGIDSVYRIPLTARPTRRRLQPGYGQLTFLRSIDIEKRSQPWIETNKLFRRETQHVEIRQHLRRLTYSFCQRDLDAGKSESSINRMGRLLNQSRPLAALPGNAGGIRRSRSIL